MEHINAEILRAIADGKKVQYRDTTSVENYNWKDFEVEVIEACWSVLTGVPKLEWRIAPKTIKIGDVEVPEPCREPLERCTNYWAFTPFMGVMSVVWVGDSKDYFALNDGFVHLTQEAAEKHYEAIKKLLKEK